MRDGVRVCEVYNDGLSVFLYDAANREALREVGAALVHSDEDSAEYKRAAKRVAAQRSLVQYELAEDDSLRVGVVVGPPLTAKERRGVPWRKPATTLLALPSGRLCVESLNALAIDGAEAPSDRGAEVEVPPGEYVLTLHRVDFEQLEGDYDGPSEIVTLTPVAEVEKPPKFKLLLPYSNEKRPPWQGRYRLDGETFSGELISADDRTSALRIWINADGKAAERLGWARGSHLEVTLGDQTLDVYFYLLHKGIPGLAGRFAYVVGLPWLERFRQAAPRLLLGTLVKEHTFDDKGSYRDAELLELTTFPSSGVTEADQAALVALPRGTPVSIRTVAPFEVAEPIDESPLAEFARSLAFSYRTVKAWAKRPDDAEPIIVAARRMAAAIEGGPLAELVIRPSLAPAPKVTVPMGALVAELERVAAIGRGVSVLDVSRLVDVLKTIGPS